MKQMKRGFSFILIITIIICNILPDKMVTAAQNTKKITINGNINYYIEEDGSKNAKNTFKQLNNYPITLVYENTGNDTAKGAINIARVINNARNFMKIETRLDIRKIKVY